MIIGVANGDRVTSSCCLIIIIFIAVNQKLTPQRLQKALEERQKIINVSLLDVPI